ncbi:MAG: (E)-4-hydroxy-3-methylbut-2-enyl-diphosphate synthase [Acidobacteria bacterium]|nr:(E)-4-hydroxy-3-methylbut-2-enyl-diphosphate synthase [Acidobacteriota bacterium]
MIDLLETPPYCPSPFAYTRRPTRVVQVGDVGIGGDNPIRVQSMTTPATTDVAATVAQIERLVAAGCEIVRITVPSSADAEALPRIRAGMKERALRVPLVADIHFSPQAALLAVPYVEKVRINPGNFADKKRFVVREYSDEQYNAELERLQEKLTPLIHACAPRRVALRIGTNHGSLSDRILNRYGDTPLGMVESALEFVRICRRLDFHDIILSMKASHTMVAIQAYRLLAARMDAEGMDYPFHLGVTEAGDGEDGRIKSAIGIGALLDDGIGDTVRVSLTEDPVAEIPVARALVQPYNERSLPVTSPALSGVRETRRPYDYRRRPAAAVSIGGVTCGGNAPIRVENLLSAPPADEATARRALEILTRSAAGADTPCEILEVVVSRPRQVDDMERLVDLAAELAPDLAITARPTAAYLHAEAHGAFARLVRRVQRLAFRVHAPLNEDGLLKRGVGLDLAGMVGRPICWVLTPAAPGTHADVAAHLAVDLLEHTRRAGLPHTQVALEPGFAPGGVGAYRLLAERLAAADLHPSLILVDRPSAGEENGSLAVGARLGSLLCDGMGDAVRVEIRNARGERSDAPADLHRARELAYTILQGTRVRVVKTEFISCPSCGRTMFDLEETTRRIKERTGHLKGLKIAIMGCVVNGPGEMADADFGYVGWGPGKVALFVGHEMVAKDIDLAHADERLVQLIKDHGRWVEPA